MEEISSQLFSYDSKTRTFTADISELEAVHGPTVVVWKFGIRSEKTGAVVQFSEIVTTRDREGEVQSWIYTSEYLPSIGGTLSAVIFND
jgi:hypothetical protein